VNFDAGGRKPPGRLDQRGRVRSARIASDHLLSAGAQRQGRGDARAGEADDQVGPTRQRRTRPAGYAFNPCWKTTKPIAPKAAATIQKRRMIFVSDQACSSK
jgi:hypothetical protein